jgi:hypothetical protein
MLARDALTVTSIVREEKQNRRATGCISSPPAIRARFRNLLREQLCRAGLFA